MIGGKASISGELHRIRRVNTVVCCSTLLFVFMVTINFLSV